MGRGWTDTGYFTIVSNYVLEDTALSAKARFIYTLLVRYGRWKKVGSERYLVTWVSRKKLAELVGESEWSISQRIRELVGRNLIERSRRPGGSSVTYICDPRTLYKTEAPEIPTKEIIDDPNDDANETLEILDSEPDSASLTDANVIVGPAKCREIVHPTTETAQIDECLQKTSADLQTAKPDKDVDVEKDITILSDKEPANGAALTAPDRNTGTTTGKGSPDEVEKISRADSNGYEIVTNDLKIPMSASKEIGILARRMNSKLTTKASPKIGAPDDAVGIDADDPRTAKAIWNEFHRIVAMTFSGYNVPDSPMARELANCRMLLNEYTPADIVKLFEMVATRWSVIREKWPRVAKVPIPTFYVAFTLRRDLMPIVQSGQGLTSRSDRHDPSAKVPKLGWGDE